MNSERPWGEDDSRRSSLRSTSIYDAEGTGAGMEYVFLRGIFYDNNEVSKDFLSRTIAATNIPHPVIPITDEMITTVNGNSSLFGVVIVEVDELDVVGSVGGGGVGGVCGVVGDVGFVGIVEIVVNVGIVGIVCIVVGFCVVKVVVEDELVIGVVVEVVVEDELVIGVVVEVVVEDELVIGVVVEVVVEDE